MPKMKSTKRKCSDNDDQHTSQRHKAARCDFSCMPLEVLLCTLKKLPYEEVSKCRLVSKQWNHASKYILNLEFIRVKQEVLKRCTSLQNVVKKIEVKDCKNHPMIKASEMFDSVNVRLTVLNLRMGKHLERKEICFYGGKLLDEVNLILRDERTPLENPLEAFLNLITKIENHFLGQIQPNLPARIFMEKWDVAMCIAVADPNLAHMCVVTDADVFRTDNVFSVPYNLIEDNLFTKKDVDI